MVTEEQIRAGARAFITSKLARDGVTVLPNKDVLEDVPEELLSDIMDDVEAVLRGYAEDRHSDDAGEAVFNDK